MTRRISAAVVLLLSTVAMGQATRPATTERKDGRPIVPEARGAATQGVRAELPTLFLVGDSTMNSNAPLRGWGSEMAALVDTSRMNVAVRAIGGRSSKTFLLEGRWERVLNEIKAGDVVIVQFGHNDAGRFDDPNAKGRPSLRGEGEEASEWVKPDGTRETVRTFGWYLRNYARTAQERGATVILASMVPHKSWERAGEMGKERDVIRRGEREAHVLWTKHAAEATGAMFLDVNELVAQRYEEMGKEKVEGLFGDARTHYNAAGARVTAAVVAEALRKMEGGPLAGYLK